MAKKLAPRTRDPVRTREMLLQAGAEGFAQSGFSGASIDSIAARAGFSKGAFYANFESKEALLLELMHVTFERENARATALLETSDGFEDSLRLFAALFDESESHLNWVMLAMELQLHAVRDPAFGERFESLYAIQRTHATRIYTELFRQAGKRAPPDLEEIVDRYLALGQSLVLHNARRRRVSGDGDGRTPGQWNNYFIRMLIGAAAPLEGGLAAGAPGAASDPRLGHALRALTDGSAAGDDALVALLKAAAKLRPAA